MENLNERNKRMQGGCSNIKYEPTFGVATIDYEDAFESNTKEIHKLYDENEQLKEDLDIAKDTIKMLAMLL